MILARRRRTLHGRRQRLNDRGRASSEKKASGRQRNRSRRRGCGRRGGRCRSALREQRRFCRRPRAGRCSTRGSAPAAPHRHRPAAPRGGPRAAPGDGSRRSSSCWRSSTTSRPGSIRSASRPATTHAQTRRGIRPSARRTPARTRAERTLLGVLGTFNSGCAKLIVPILNRAPGGAVAMSARRTRTWV